MNSKQALIHTLLAYEVLQFGRFQTKSGRISSIFFNTGNFCSGRSLGIFAEAFAQCIAEEFSQKEAILFGPAYKGIPLVTLVADRLQILREEEVFFSYNRKEKKPHGEGGELAGYNFRGGEKVIIVEDVLTAGTSIRESLRLLQERGLVVIGAVVGIDREERGQGLKSAREEINEEFNLPVHSLLRLTEILALLPAGSPEQLAQVAAYRQERLVSCGLLA